MVIVILFAQLNVVRLADLPQNLNFSIPQAQEIWDSVDILGDSTQFNFPLSMGTSTYSIVCIETVMQNVISWGIYLLGENTVI